MAFIIPRNPTMIESLTQGFQQAAPGMIQGAQNRLQQQDLAALQDYQQQMQAYQNQRLLPNPFHGAMAGPMQEPQMPQFKSPQFQNVQAQSMLSQMFRDPLQTALLQSQIAKNVQTGQKTSQASSVITDPEDPSRAIRVRDTFDQQGNIINRQVLGEATLAEKVGNVNPDVFNQMQKPVASKIQSELKEAVVEVDALKKVRDQHKDEYSEIPFKIGAGITKVQEKAGGLLGEPTKVDKKTLGEYAAWKRASQQQFVAFKKWATGVAAGQKEMAEQIETAFPSALKDSPSEYKAKLDDAIAVRERTIQILTDMLNSGQITSVAGKKEAEQAALRQALDEYRVITPITERAGTSGTTSGGVKWSIE